MLNKISKFMVIASMLMFGSYNAYAETDILNRNAPEDFQSLDAPTITVVGKDRRFILGMGGYIKTIAGVDFGHPIELTDEFIISEIPMQPTEGNESRFFLSSKQTHLFLNLIAFPDTKNEVGAFISANLLNDYCPTLQFAYLKYRGLQVGYDYTLFSDPACGVPSVDYEGPCAYTAIPVVGINYNWKSTHNTHWELAVGMELPQSSFSTVDGKNKPVYQRFPDIPMAAKYSYADGNSWVRISSILRTLTYRDLVKNSNRNCFGYGFQLSGAAHFLEKLTFYYEGVWGKGIASLIQDGVYQGLDLVPDNHSSSLSPATIWGGFCSLEYDINSRLIASATYSHLRTYASRFDGGSTPWSDLYKYGQYASANIFYNINSSLDIGLEYIWGRRANNDGTKCADNRIQLSFQFSF